MTSDSRIYRAVAILCFCLVVVLPTRNIAAEPLVSSELTEEQKKQFKERFKEDASAILKVVDRWAKSWSELDVEGYLSCYEKDYYPQAYSSAISWRVSRRDRFKRQKWVNLKMTGMALSLRGGGIYAVEFTQDYKSDSYRDTTTKELLFRNLGDGWLIAGENTVNIQTNE